MIKGIAHIGVGVKNLDEAMEYYRRVFGLECSEPESFGELRFSFVPVGNTHVELLESTTPGGVIRKFIDKKGEGVHHLSYEVEDIEGEVAALKARGMEFVTEKPYLNAHQNRVIFLHPKSTKGILTELMQVMNKNKK